MAAYLHYRNGFCSIGQSALCARQKNNGVFNHMLNTIYNHPRQFLTTLALGNIILLGWIIYFLIEILDPALMTLHAYEKRSGSVFFYYCGYFIADCCCKSIHSTNDPEKKS